VRNVWEGDVWIAALERASEILQKRLAVQSNEFLS
jgi:hypothetical protein